MEITWTVLALNMFFRFSVILYYKQINIPHILNKYSQTYKIPLIVNINVGDGVLKMMSISIGYVTIYRVILVYI